MPLIKNNIVIASAGSRKTTYIVDDALSVKDEPVLITTYTNENVKQVIDYIYKKASSVPPNIKVVTWFSFLLRDCVKPYLNKLCSFDKVNSIYFDRIPDSIRFIPKSNSDKYYFTNNKNIYRDRVSDFVCNCNNATNGLILSRLEKVYKNIYIDEAQDLNGWDFELLKMISASTIKLTLVGDPRQTTYQTNNNRRAENLKSWINKNEVKNNYQIIEKNECYRSNQKICDFGDSLYPEYSTTISKNFDTTDHDGIFIIKASEVSNYIERYSPQILRYDKNTNTFGYQALNIGVSKGRTFDRVLIFPTNPMKKYLKTKNLTDAGKIEKLYVAITRAKYSVAFVIADNETIDLTI